MPDKAYERVMNDNDIRKAGREFPSGLSDVIVIHYSFVGFVRHRKISKNINPDGVVIL